MGRRVDECSKLIVGNYYFDYRLRDIGVPRKYVGYYYIIDILDLLINSGKDFKCFSREIYPYIAEKYQCGVSTIERDIRNCIDKYWETDDRCNLRFFWHKDEKPTCKEFIFALKHYIMFSIA